MVKRNLTIPFEFICFTDDSTNIIPEVQTMPLIDEKLRGWWGKISYFKSPLFDLEGTVLALDLDLIIVDNIDCFFEHPGNFCIAKDRDSRNGNNTSVIRFEIGKHPDIYNDLKINQKDICTGEPGEKLERKRYWGDQVWITEKRPTAINFPSEWIRSYKWDCLDKQGKMIIPQNCKIILFHGTPNPKDVEQQLRDWWYV